MKCALCLILALGLLGSPSAQAEEEGKLLQKSMERALEIAKEKYKQAERWGQPRIIPKGAKPEILIQQDWISINGKRVKLGDPLEAWKKVLPGTPFCRSEDYITKQISICFWDEIGISIMSLPKKSGRTYQFEIYLNLEIDPYSDLATTTSDGTPSPPRRKFRPEQTFPGYLEFDGYGINKDTEFWEVRNSVDPKRNLRCGLRDCSHPHGYFSEEANLYLRLNRSTDRGNIYEISLSGSGD